jgi:hypothetical protein
MKCTSPSRTLRRVVAHLKANPHIIRFGTLVRIKGLRLTHLKNESDLRKALTAIADLINLPDRFRKCLLRLQEIIAIAGRCIGNALALQNSSFAPNSVVMIKKSARDGWFKIIGILPDWQLVLQSVSGQKTTRTCSAHDLELVTL